MQNKIQILLKVKKIKFRNKMMTKFKKIKWSLKKKETQEKICFIISKFVGGKIMIKLTKNRKENQINLLLMSCLIIDKFNKFLI